MAVAMQRPGAAGVGCGETVPIMRASQEETKAMADHKSPWHELRECAPDTIAAVMGAPLLELKTARSLVNRLRPFILALASGATYEALSVVWVHQATHGTAWATALVSGLQALAMVVGVGESVKDWHVAPAFVLGYAAGAFGAMTWG
jgi:hypothetical protein